MGAACCVARDKEIVAKTTIVKPQGKEKGINCVTKQLCNKKVLKDPGFFPSEQIIALVSEEYLIELRITDVLYRFDTQERITRLTYQFSDGALSPKSGSYLEEPTKRFILPKSAKISKIETYLEESSGLFPFR